MIPVGSSSRLAARSSADAHIAHLVAHPRQVVAAHGVVVGDGAAGLHDRFAGRALGGAPLLELGALLLAGEEGEVERGPRRVQVRDVAHHQRRRAAVGQRLAQGAVHRRAQVRQAAPRAGGLQRLHHDPAVHQDVAQVGPGEPPVLPRAPGPPAQRHAAARPQQSAGALLALGDVVLAALVAHDRQAAALVAAGLEVGAAQALGPPLRRPGPSTAASPPRRTGARRRATRRAAPAP